MKLSSLLLALLVVTQLGCVTEKVVMPDITEQEAKDEAERIRVIHEHMTK